MKAADGTLYSIEWTNPYSEPPDGAPRVLAEVYTLGREPPAEFAKIRFSLGGGYGKCVRHVSPPGKQLPSQTLARVRQKRLARRINAKVPLFAEFFIQKEMEKKPEFYKGITDPALQKAHDDVQAEEWERYQGYLVHLGEVIVYADEPQECKTRATQLKVEISALQKRE